MSRKSETVIIDQNREIGHIIWDRSLAGPCWDPVSTHKVLLLTQVAQKTVPKSNDVCIDSLNNLFKELLRRLPRLHSIEIAPAAQ